MKNYLFTILTAGVMFLPLYAEYNVFVNKSEPYADRDVIRQEVLFFGELEDYTESVAAIRKNIAAHGIVGMANGLQGQSANLAKGLMSEGLKAGAAGIGIGLVIGALDPFVMSMYADQYYVKVFKVTLKNGKTVYMNRFFIGDKNPSLSKEEIDAVLGGKK